MSGQLSSKELSAISLTADEASEKSTQPSIVQPKLNLLLHFVDQPDEDLDTSNKDYLDNLDSFNAGRLSDDASTDLDSMDGSVDNSGSVSSVDTEILKKTKKSIPKSVYQKRKTVKPTVTKKATKKSIKTKSLLKMKAPKPKKKQSQFGERSTTMNNDDLHSLSRNSSGRSIPSQPSSSLYMFKVIKHPEPRKKKKYVIHTDEGSSSNSNLSTLSIHRDDEIYVRNELMANLRPLPDINDLTDVSSFHSIAVQRKVDKPTDKTKSSREYDTSIFDEYDTQSLFAESVGRATASSKTTGLNTAFPSLSSLSDEVHVIDAKTRSVMILDVTKRLTDLSQDDSSHQILETDPSAQQNEILEPFLQELISRAVATVEDKVNQLNHSLDKEKLMKQLISSITQLRSVASKRRLLAGSLKDHFLRRKEMTYITVEGKFDKFNYKRWRKSLLQLDRLLEIQSKTLDQVDSQLIKLNEELEATRMDSALKIVHLEHVIRSTLLTKDSFTHLAIYVDDTLRRMGVLRDELSEMRLELFNTQHRYADIKYKSDKLENLGGGLKMQDYLSQQAETYALSAKIRDRNKELQRLHQKIKFNMHALAHHKCKAFMEGRNYLRLKDQMEKSEERKALCQKLIYLGKLTHNRIQRDLHKLKTSGPLLFYPQLMSDYDDTLVFLEKKHAAVAKLREDLSRLTERLIVAERRLAEDKEEIKMLGSTVKAGTARKGAFVVNGQSVL
ncbi:hypothetical protein AWZ03_007135 [Drosophila navojoa]|uniref:CCDC113/CCDC96 coiled-coil domain-containing protein n=1 Tax=Drosophila navojoa TaxID=7232 RepID=A0A484BCN4_DRONA|nr:uncharacterized protein LOC108649311 [Drosophila navojoa]TDG46479.1 hypothetical protein AWZ03_007135 [Drosophila navojoa]